MFYPGEAGVLRKQLAHCLGRAATRRAQTGRPKILVVPHAGYVYSGPIAGSAYARLAPFASGIKRVVLLGPVHRVAVRGLALPTVTAFDTPLGRVALDTAAMDLLQDLPQVLRDDRPHAQEHSLEVQLPFLQTVLGDDFALVPLAVGNATAQEVAEVIERLWGGDETLILISSDLSHYLPYAQAQQADRSTAERINALATDLHTEEACGARALNGALLAARSHGLHSEMIDLRNSGDTAGDRGRVVGYGAFALVPRPDTSSVSAGGIDDDASLGAALLARAGNAIRARLGLNAEPEVDHPALQEPGATFVTLHDAHGALRGCVGRLEAQTNLAADIRHNAEAAAFRDPRFAPITAADWPGLKIEVSLLEPPQALPRAATQDAALAHITPGTDGVTLEWRGRRATFLPQVWAQLPEPVDFMAALKRKAALAPDFWASDVQLSRYRVRSFE
jgi:AmmeMemoRadiSam system protein B/AmmeMemoRadiSam system protein A